jgi:hypothetical protein
MLKTLTNPRVNRNLSGYTYGGPQRLRQPFSRPWGGAAAGGFAMSCGQSAMQRVALRLISHGP